MAKVHAQQDALFAGSAIEVPGVIDLWGPSGSGRVVALVEGPGVAVGAEGQGTNDQWHAEPAKVALNRADVAMLLKGGMEEEAANAVVARRRARSFGSVEELATVPGIDVAGLMSGSEASGERENEKKEALVGWLTVQSYEPAVRMVPWGSGVAGDARVDVRQSLPEVFLKDLEAELGKAAWDRVSRAMRQGRAGLTRSRFAVMLKNQGVAKASWGKVLDAVTFGDDAFVPGLVDLNGAPAKVLACVPGISAEIASGIVKGREEIEDDRRRLVTWPLDAGIMTEDEFIAAADWLCTRSLQWRYRLTVGELAGSSMEDGVRERGRLVVDIVIDASDGRPRLAYYRDVTHMALAMAMEREVSATAAKLEAERKRLAPPPPPPLPPPSSSQTGTAATQPPRENRASGPRDRDRGRRNGGTRPQTGTRGEGGEDGEPEKKASGLKDRRQGRWRTDGSAI